MLLEAHQPATSTASPMRSIPSLALTALLLGAGTEEAFTQCQPAIRRLIDAGMLVEARDQMSQAVASRPKDDAAWECLGQVVIATGRARDASKHFEKAIEIDPGDWVSRAKIGTARHDR